MPRNAVDLVGPEARKYLEDPWAYIVRPEEEMVNASGPVVPHWDRRLKDNRDVRVSSIRKLGAAGLISWRRRASCHVGFLRADERRPDPFGVGLPAGEPAPPRGTHVAVGYTWSARGSLAVGGLDGDICCCGG